MNPTLFYTLSLLSTRVHYVPDQNLTYLNNPKVACSTIKKSIWLKDDEDRNQDTYAGDPHDKVASPFCITQREKYIMSGIYDLGLDNFINSTFFSVVRNPFVKILSAYIDKIAEPRDLEVWTPFGMRFRLSGDAQPSFIEFLHMICSEEPTLLDWHFAPQYVNLLYGLAPLSFVGQLESMEDTSEFLSQFGIETKTHIPHATNALERIKEFYGPDETELVLNYFQRDFEIFGYSPNPRQVEPVSKPNIETIDKSIIKSFIEIHKDPDREIKKTAITRLKELGSNISRSWF